MFICWPFIVVQLRAAVATPYFISIPVWAHHLRGAPWSIIPDECRRLLCHFSGLLCLKLWYISSSCFLLTHWGRVTHICVGNLTIIGPDNGLSPGRCQAIIWTNAGILLIGPLGTNFSEILNEILTFSFKKMRLKVSSAKWRPFRLGLNEF